MLSNKIRREMAEEGVEIVASVSLQEALAALFGDRAAPVTRPDGT